MIFDLHSHLIRFFFFSFSQDKDLLQGTIAMSIGYHQWYDLFSLNVLFFPNLMPIFSDDLNSFCFKSREVVLDRELITGKAMTVIKVSNKAVCWHVFKS